MKTAKFDHNRTIYREGEEGHTMYVIRSGRVSILGAYGREGEKKVTELRAGDVFGVMSILESTPRGDTAVSSEDGTELEEVSADDLDTYLCEHPETMRHLLSQMSHQIRELTEGHKDVIKAVADYEVKIGDEKKKSELDDRIQRIVSIYQNRYPGLFNISMKEAKDDVKFIFDASKSK